MGLTSSMQGIVIPKGKILTINKGGITVPSGAPCVLEEDITLNLSSTFAPLLSGGMPNIVKILSGVLGPIIGRDIPVGFKQFGYQIWQNTDPLSFSPTVSFYMNTNAKTDVYDPTMELIKLPLPTEVGNKGGLKAPGPSIFSLFGEDGKVSGYVDKHTEGDFSITTGDILSLQIGQLLYLSNIIVKKAEPTFSLETDEFGYPIWSKVRLDISTVEIATNDMIRRSKPLERVGGR